VSKQSRQKPRPSARQKRVEKLLDPRKRGSASSGGEFWLDTLFLSLPDIKSNRAFSDRLRQGDVETLVTSGIAAHEQAHWIQNHGTSYGLFFALTRISRLKIAGALWGSRIDEERHQLAAQRRNGQPILTLKSDSRPIIPPSDLPYFARMKRHWWSLAACAHAFDQASFDLIDERSLRYVFGLASTYVSVGGDIDKIIAMTDPALRDHILSAAPRFTRRNIEQAKSLGLSTANIAETAAVVSQHLTHILNGMSLQDSGDKPRMRAMALRHQRMWRQVMTSSYRNAFRQFQIAHPRVELDSVQALQTLLLISDIALNPPIAPFVSLAKQPELRRWQWIYPPLRFAALVAGTRKTGLPKEAPWDLTAREAAELENCLCDAAGIPAPSAYLKRAPVEVLRRRAKKQRFSCSALEDLILDAASAAIRLRRLYPAAIVFNCASTSFSRALVSDPKLKPHQLAWEPPLTILNGRGYANPDFQERYYEVAGAACMAEFWRELMVGVGPPAFSGVPTDPDTRRLMGAIRAKFEKSFGCSPFSAAEIAAAIQP